MTLHDMEMDPNAARPMPMGHRRNVVKSVARTLETLELFDELRRPLNVVEVSTRLGYPQSSTSALLKSMVAMGYLDYQARQRTYFPTDRVALTGAWINPSLHSDGKAIKLVKAVMARSERVVLLAARNGDDALYIHVAQHPKSTTHHIGLGTRRPIGTSGVGRALLSTMSDHDVRCMFRRINAYRDPDREPVNIPDLIASLAETRKAGYYISRHQVVDGSGLIAMLLPTSCTDRPLVLGLGAPVDQIDSRKEEFLTIMREEIVKVFGPHAQLQHNAPAWIVPKTGKIRAAGM
ncbi:IclR family transcriptional regulator [Tropicimonas isoalkanivorans]|uniref:Transcriptional regulator, IclR family n=1 Tax=Tropicimonas isoalkanivorans TaxID=441112 RepID=A0A1I1HUA6_9RHOB|nr:helix-turn-helix domain-containing protein [Tropicimonas isoalkanivorans]SFC27385.1 transcriptional regulator, IclR family [Tropicimonas isoalkanivorans]